VSCQDVFSTFAEENVYKPEEDNVDICHRKRNINDKHVKGRSGWWGVCCWKCSYFPGVAHEVCVHMLTESSCSCCFKLTHFAKFLTAPLAVFLYSTHPSLLLFLVHLVWQHFSLGFLDSLNRP